MRDRLIGIFNSWNLQEYIPSHTEIAMLADYLLVNGVIVPPCKVGDTVWFLNRHPSIHLYRNFVYEAMVVRVYVEHGNQLCLAIRIKNEWGVTEYPHIKEIGKTVFLTKEDAERALEGATGAKGCIGICPNCGRGDSIIWDSEKDVCHCTCGWSDEPTEKGGE